MLQQASALAPRYSTVGPVIAVLFKRPKNRVHVRDYSAKTSRIVRATSASTATVAIGTCGVSRREIAAWIIVTTLPL